MEVVRELPLDQVLLGDCVQLMRMLPPASVHCVFADPPYNLQLRGELRRPDDSLVDGVDEDWDRFTDFATYDAFTREWLAECRRLLRKDGTPPAVERPTAHYRGGPDEAASIAQIAQMAGRVGRSRPPRGSRQSTRSSTSCPTVPKLGR